jgi:hypothetical protein
VLPAVAQTDFQYQQYPTANNAGVAPATANAHAADFNNDGLADVLVASNYSCSAAGCVVRPTLDLYMNSGTGLNARARLSVALQGSSPEGEGHEVAVGDFNGDRNLDIAALNSSGSITLLYGHGDGTFGAPVTLPIGSQIYTALVAADFDGDGSQDLAVLNASGELLLLLNDGRGNFSPQEVQIDTPRSGFTTDALVVGDFNADGWPDIAWVEQGNGTNQFNTAFAALNEGDGTFGIGRELGTTTTGVGFLRTADLDLDGNSDVIAWSTQIDEDCCAALPVTAYYSNGDGTFNSADLTSGITDDVGVTDVNGDGVPDVLVSGNAGLTVLIGTGNRTFTDDGTYSSLPGAAALQAIGFFDSTNRIGLSVSNAIEGPNNGNPLYLLTNDNAQDECPYPASAGVTFCEATQTGDTVRVRGTARAQTEPVQHIEIWANSEKLYQVYSDEFDVTLTLPAGTLITAVEVEANGETRITSTSAQASSCAAPGAPGVNVCSPSEGEVMQSPVTVVASGSGASGAVNHLEMWMDGAKVGNYAGATMSASMPLANGSHAVTVVEVDSNGAVVRSPPADFTVGSTGTCAAPSSAGVDVCLPAKGESTASPVAFVATGTGASGAVNHLELWVDGNKLGNYSGATMNASVPVAAGSHTVTIVEVDSKGRYVKSAPVSFTVQ